MQRQKSVESYKHKYAKNVLVKWLRENAKASNDGLDWTSFGEIHWRPNRCAPSYGVYEEYPVNSKICSNGYVYCWDEHWPLDEGQDGLSSIPTYEQLCNIGQPPELILDVAVHHKGCIKYGFEVVHKNPVSRDKSEKLIPLNTCVYEVSAEWILSQVEKPTDFQYLRVWRDAYV